MDLSEAAFDNGTPVLVDADSGRVVLWPSEATIASCRERRKAQTVVDPSVGAGGVVTESGQSVALWANINHPSEAREVLRHRLEGIGLFRTELLAIDYGRLPNEDEQLAEYSGLMEGCSQCPVVFRTFDLGGDKIVPDLNECSGSNPALGIRGIRRHLLRQPQELEQQFRAILRAAHAAKASILLPMVTHRGDVATARRILLRVTEGLREQGVPYNGRVRLGAMLEVPAAVFAVRDILSVVDFVSIGTNDLVQYLAAADRDNQSVLPYLDPDQAGLPGMIDLVMAAALESGRQEDVFVCGDLASDPIWAARFVAKGIRALSIIPATAPQVRTALARS
jgi:phosphotransferase system enzyme I (PtsI)